MNVDINSLSVRNAQLPLSYKQAKVALANCAAIDECVDWADKAQALASYARQADDDALQKLAVRIQGRAVRRCGELLKLIDGRGGDQTENAAAVTFAPTRRDAAEQAGMSVRQQVTAVRVANVPEGDFEAALERETPLTVTKLADLGRKPRDVAPPTPLAEAMQRPGFQQATQAIGRLDELAAFCRGHDATFVAAGVHSSEAADLRKNVGVIDAWLDQFIINVEG